MLLESSKMEQRYGEVPAVIRDGLTLTEVAETFGVSHPDARPPWGHRFGVRPCNGDARGMLLWWHGHG